MRTRSLFAGGAIVVAIAGATTFAASAMTGAEDPVPASQTEVTPVPASPTDATPVPAPPTDATPVPAGETAPVPAPVTNQ